jgi:hypothetical protein
MRKWHIWLGAVLLALAAAAWLFPYLLKRYIEAHSEEWIGRKVSIGRIVLNPFSGVYAVDRFTCTEPGTDTVFVRFDRLSMKADVIAGLRTGRWGFKEARLEAPYARIVQHGNRFNFSDLLELGGDDSVDVRSREPSEAAFSVVDMLLSDGAIAYQSDVLPAPIAVQDLRVACTEISSGQATMDFLVGFSIAGGGRADGGFTINTQAGSYGVDARLRDFRLAQLRPYLEEFMRCGGLTGELDLDVRVDDNYLNTTGFALGASMDLRGLELSDPDGQRLLQVGQLRARLDTLIAAERRLEVGEVLLDRTEAWFTMLNDGSDNWTRLLKLRTDSVDAGGAVSVSASNVFVMLADYIRYLGQQFVASAYSARSIRITDCAVHFEDYAPRRPFRYAITGLYLASDRITTEQDTGRIAVSASLNGSGALTGAAAFDPSDLRNVRLDLGIDGLLLTGFDSYGRWYAAHPVQEGVLAYHTSTAIRDGRIDSRNSIRIEGLRFGKKIEDHAPDIHILPLRLAAGLLKDVKGAIAFDVPVSGDLNDPAFKPWPLVWQVVKNLVVRAVTAPARLLVRAFDGMEEKELEGLRLEPMQAAPDERALKSLRQLARVLKAKPDLRVDLVPLVDARTEAEELALHAAKCQYLFGSQVVTPSDSARAAALANADTLFLRFVEEAVPATAGKPLQQRCAILIGPEALGERQRQLERTRQEAVMRHLASLGADSTRVGIRTGSPEEVGGRTGQPGYRFIFDAAEVPEPSLP